MKPFSIIVGYRGSDRAIGMNGKLPWRIDGDMKFFRDTTKTTDIKTRWNAVIMGHNTFKGMDRNPLRGRVNFVCTSENFADFPDRNMWCIHDTTNFDSESICLDSNDRRNMFPPLYFVKTLEDALKICHAMGDIIEKAFVIGGEQLYRYALQHPLCEELIINEFSSSPGEFDINKISCDTFFPEIDDTEYKLVIDKTLYSNTEMFENISMSCTNRLFDIALVNIQNKQYMRTTV